ncbi:ankyrin repeat domain-containing protein SOWAHC [Accipiter gentilis]|nr:ankyrin repeat domain-containing protein SOWAHC [Accipiter gentilis]XP_049690365.1 ankyrin repeat domain-containing protein SOWAHC [Accipiter gentilis]XP_049690366.1 ankyrin repeat domain-containing protein SOWAHC [Accipiter gentilis]XP_049690367.1 ankyrin repeat domain-containing protein SOWAHC [Accipiter gentilis]XP_049690368.1 ankyrin repeat domain-containing protein SOWAHC [Accipiter gentilis]
MAEPAELRQESVVRFLAARGGRARNAELLEHFRDWLSPSEPGRRAAARQRFKELVNAVATVRQEPGTGVKYVHLRRRYCAPEPAATAAAPLSPGEKQAAAAVVGDSAERPSPPPSPRAGAEAAPPPPPPQPPAGEDAGSRPQAMGRRGEPPRPSPAAAGGQRRGSRRGPPPPAVGRGGGEEAAVAAGPGRPPPPPAEEAGAAEGPPGAAAQGGGRRSLREAARGGSPQLKRGALPGGGRGGRGGGGGDSDSASVASSSAEEEGSTTGSVALDPLEHAWMLSASDGRWESLEGLLSCEPALLCKRDFITGFTVLHWAAKHGRQELLATLVNFAQRHQLPVDINARTSGGHTALHIAAMHGHAEVVKLLVGAYDADVDIRDYSGRKAAQYLHQGTSGDMRSLVGALEEEEEEEEGAAGNGSGRWRLSKVLPANLMSYRLSHHHHHHHHSTGEEAEGTEGAAVAGKGKEMTRKASGSGRMKPRLNKIRFRTQIIHNTPSFRGDTEEEEHEEKSLKASFKLRPKSNVFG